MSAPEPIASDTIQTLEQDPPFFQFPPFPQPPPGVTIMSFKDFKPRGIQLFADHRKGGGDGGEDEDVELDALGIPTVELRAKHATDECKSNPRKKRKKKKTLAAERAVVVPPKRSPWYEEWEEGEDLRVMRVRYDPRLSPVDRFFQSAYDFRTGRPWPPVASGLNNLWDQFRLFTGLLVNPSVYRKAGAKKSARAESPDFHSDDEDDGMDDGDAGDAPPTKRQRSGETPDFDDEGDPQKLDEEIREEKISIFLSDPEKAVRIFLSSYMREHGLIWSERNLIHTPRLVYFFLAFVLRNRVLPEPVYQRGLKQALERIEWAKKELPLTDKVGKSIPDAFNEACRECFGRQGGINWSVVNGTSTTEQGDATITVTDFSGGTATHVALPTEAQIQLKDAIEDNVDVKVSIDGSSTVVSPANEDASNSNGWGTGWGGTWATEESERVWAQSGSWDDATQESQGANGEAGADNNWGGDTDPSWNRDLRSLFSLLGPSAFPLTHTTGVIECSTRRVSAIRFPPNHPKSDHSPSPIHLAPAQTGLDWTPSAEGVEAELDARFAKITLEPWGREEGDITGPEIWTASRGPVIDPQNRSKTPSAGARRPHDPLKDKITLLVEPSFAEMLELVPGLGLGAMWIEIARQQVGRVGQVDSDTPVGFWYHEDVTGIFPSFYTPQQKEYNRI